MDLIRLFSRNAQAMLLALIMLPVGVLVLLAPVFVGWSSHNQWIYILLIATMGYALYGGIFLTARHCPLRPLQLPAGSGPIGFSNVAVIILVGLGLRLLWRVAILDSPLITDSEGYVQLARNLLDHGSYFEYYPQGLYPTEYRGPDPLILYSYRPPLLPFLIAALLSLGWSIPWILFAIDALAYLGLSLGFYYWVRHRIGVGLATNGLWALAICPPLIVWTGAGMTEILGMALLLPAIGFFDRAVSSQGPHLSWAMGAGVFAALAALARAEFIIFPLIWFVMIFFRPSKRGLGLLVLATITMILCVLPWVLRNVIVYGDLTMITTGGGITFFTSNHEGSSASWSPKVWLGPFEMSGNDEVAAQEIYYRAAYDWIYNNPWKFMVQNMKGFALMGSGNLDSILKVSLSLREDIWYKIAAFLVKAGWLSLTGFCLLRGWQNRRNLLKVDRMLIGPLTMMATILLVHTLYEAHFRHSLPIIWMLLLCALCGKRLTQFER